MVSEAARTSVARRQYPIEQHAHKEARCKHENEDSCGTKFGVLPWLGACSGGSDVVEIELAPAASDAIERSGEETLDTSTFQTWEEAYADHMRALSTPLSGDEQVEVEQRLAEAGVDLDQVTFKGRMLAFGDVLVDATSLLGGDEAAEKGKTMDVVLTAETGVGISAPDLYSSDPDGVAGSVPLLFWRPFVDQGHYYVVPDSPSFLFDLFQSALNDISAAADDCLHSPPNQSNLNVLTASQWAAIGIAQNFVSKTYVFWGGPAFSPGTVCVSTTGSTTGCAVFPRFGSVASVTRMLPGTAVGLVSESASTINGVPVPYVNGNNAKSKAIVTHEILHTLGVAHSYESIGAIVPGTSASTSVLSIMAAPQCEPGEPLCSWSHTLTADDVNTVNALYSPVPGSSCEYQHRATPICTQACTKISTINLVGHCCDCGGTRRSFVRASSTNPYIFSCQ